MQLRKLKRQDWIKLFRFDQFRQTPLHEATNPAPWMQTMGFCVFVSVMIAILSFIMAGLFLNRLVVLEAWETAPSRRIQDLVALLKQSEEKNQQLETELDKLRQAALQHTGPASTTNLASPETQKLYQMAGLMPVSGEGLKIVLKDGKPSSTHAMANDQHQDPTVGRLQAEDILKLINELKAAGAKAISINDQRLVINTEIVTSGTTLMVNQTRLSQPIVIKAIGPSDVLMNALKIRGGILEYLEFFEVDVKLIRESWLSVPAYKGSVQ